MIIDRVDNGINMRQQTYIAHTCTIDASYQDLFADLTTNHINVHD